MAEPSREERTRAQARFADGEPLPHQLAGNRGRYDLGRVLRHSLDHHNFKKPLGGLEDEVSRELALRTGVNPRGILIPLDAEVRSLTTTTGAGALVTIRGPVIEQLRARSIIGQLGVQMLTEVRPVGTIQLPKMDPGATVGWITEDNALPDAGTTIDVVPTTPHTVGAMLDITRQLRAAGPGVEAIVAGDIFGAMASELDRALFNGSGADGEPTGLLQDGDIESIPLGADGAAIAYANLVEAERRIGNADGESNATPLGFVTTPNARAKMRQTEGFTGSGRPLWRKAGTVLGHPAFATSNLPSDLAKGAGTGLSAGILGNFSGSLLTLFGGVDLVIDPFTQQGGTIIRLTAFQDADAVTRQPPAFITFKDIDTA